MLSLNLLSIALLIKYCHKSFFLFEESVCKNRAKALSESRYQRHIGYIRILFVHGYLLSAVRTDIYILWRIRHQYFNWFHLRITFVAIETGLVCINFSFSSHNSIFYSSVIVMLYLLAKSLSVSLIYGRCFSSNLFSASLRLRGVLPSTSRTSTRNSPFEM